MRGFILLAARILVSAALLYVAFRGIDLAGIQARLRQIELSWAALAVLATLALSTAKPYYFAPVWTLLLPAGAAAIEAWLPVTVAGGHS